jgi:hypothetical protein
MSGIILRFLLQTSKAIWLYSRGSIHMKPKGRLTQSS